MLCRTMTNSCRTSWVFWPERTVSAARRRFDWYGVPNLQQLVPTWTWFLADETRTARVNARRDGGEFFRQQLAMGIRNGALAVKGGVAAHDSFRPTAVA